MAAVQAGGLGMVAVGVARLAAARVSPSDQAEQGATGLWLCIAGLLGVFAVGYPGYFAFDAVWPSFYYSPVAAGKNAWLLGQALFMAIYFAGMIVSFRAVSRALDGVVMKA